MIDLAHPQLPILNLDASTSWNDVLQFAMPHLEQRGLQRLKDALAERTRSVIIERFYIDKDYRDTFSHFHSKRFSTPDSRCVRLHFFKNHVTRERLRDTVQL